MLTKKYSYVDGKHTKTQNLYEYFDVDNPDDAYENLHKYSTVEYDKKNRRGWNLGYYYKC